MYERMKGMLALPEDPMQNAAARQGLLTAGAALLGGRGNLGEILGGGLLAGSQGYQGGLAQQQQQQYRQAQTQQVEMENKRLQAAADEPMQLQRILSGGQSTPMGPPASLPRIGGAPASGSSFGAAPAPGSIAPQAPADQYTTMMGYADRLTQAGRVAQAKPYYDMAEKLRVKLMKRETLIRDGKPVSVLTYEDGREADSAYEALPDNQVVDMGGTQTIIDRNMPRDGSAMRKSIAPEAQLSAETARRGQNMTDARQREANAITRQGNQSQIVNDPLQGPMLIDKGTGQARRVMMNGQAIPGEAEAKREASASKLIPLIKQASGLIDGSTGSYWGTAADHGARLFGKATSGAENIAQLRVLEGNIMMAQPRMEGPQSNLDVDLYRQMAAQVADPTLPNSTKKAALKTLYTLYEKYDPDAGKEGNPFADPAPPKVKSVKDLPKKAAPAQAYADAEKERRYQEFKRSQGK